MTLVTHDVALARNFGAKRHGAVQAILTYNAQSTDLRGLVLCIAIYGSGGTSDDAF